MGLFDALPPPKANSAATDAAPAATAPAKRPADGEPSAATDDSSKKARSAASLDLLPSSSSDISTVQLPSAGARAAAEGGRPRWTAIEAAYSEDSGSRLSMEGEQCCSRAY